MHSHGCDHNFSPDISVAEVVPGPRRPGTSTKPIKTYNEYSFQGSVWVVLFLRAILRRQIKLAMLSLELMVTTQAMEVGLLSWSVILL